MFDSMLINACFISSWSWTSFESTRESLSNCCEELRQMRLVYPPSMFVFVFFLFFCASLTIAQTASWPIFQSGISFSYLLSNLICCPKCKLPPLPSSWGVIRLRVLPYTMSLEWNANTMGFVCIRLWHGAWDKLHNESDSFTSVTP